MKKGLANLIIIFVAGAVVGLIIGFYLPHKPKIINQSREGIMNKNITGATVSNLLGQVESVSSQSIKFSTRQLSTEGPVSITKVAKIDNATAVYLLTPKTVEENKDTYQAKVADLRDKLRIASLARDTKKLASLKAELQALALANSAERAKLASDLNVKINSSPVGSAEYQEAELAYLNLTSAFKYSKISLADIKTGDAIQVWAKDDLSAKDSFTATKIEITR